MEALYKGENLDTNELGPSVTNIKERYQNIADYFPEELTQNPLPFFVDWLLENVHFVEIEAYSDEDAYTIFETMNDRGLSLRLPDMLKGYVLANISTEEQQRRVNDIWKEQMNQLTPLGQDEDIDFFKAWFRARYAETARTSKQSSENRDYERIGNEFHRWVRDKKGLLNLNGSDSFAKFVSRDLKFYARQFRRIREAGNTFTPGLESIWYNEERRFTQQSQVLLSALTPDDSEQTILRKLSFVAGYLDIWLARRHWNSRTTAQSATRYTIFNLSKDLRDKTVEQIAALLREKLDQEEETFVSTLDFRLKGTNFRQVRHILARLTHWVDQKCGRHTSFPNLVAAQSGKPFELEHLWPNHYAEFQEWFSHPTEFDYARNKLGGLVLLQRGHNQSLGDLPYEKKREAYLSHGQNLLTASLHPGSYQNNPEFIKLIKETGLAFKPYDHFGPEAQQERQELYLRLAEWVWNPSRLDTDGVKPPVHEPLEDPEDVVPDARPKSERYEKRRRFWQGLLEVVKARNGLHAHLSPTRYHWIGKRSGILVWVYAVVQGETRIELFMDGREAAESQKLYEHLHAQRQEIEHQLNTKLVWSNKEGMQSCKIYTTVQGGWVDEPDWPAIHAKSVDTMEQFYQVFQARLAHSDS